MEYVIIHSLWMKFGILLLLYFLRFLITIEKSPNNFVIQIIINFDVEVCLRFRAEWIDYCQSSTGIPGAGNVILGIPRPTRAGNSLGTRGPVRTRPKLGIPGPGLDSIPVDY